MLITRMHVAIVCGLLVRAELVGRPTGRGAAVLLTGTVVLLGLAPTLLIHAGDVAAKDLLDPSRYIAAVGLAP